MVLSRSRVSKVPYNPHASQCSHARDRTRATKMAHAWKKIEMQMKEKRNKTRHTTRKTQKKSSAGRVLQREKLTVQRLSAEVTGKVQKFSRIGPREFVSFAGYDDPLVRFQKVYQFLT